MDTLTISEEVNQMHADLCSALADPRRILILYTLFERPHSVNEIASEIGVNQPTASRHLKIMRECGVVRANRQGMTVEYSLADPRLIEALDLLRAVMRDRILHRASLIENPIPQS